MFYTDYLHSYSLERIGTPLLVQALVFLLVLDLKDYWMHRLQHVVVFFWRFHKIHHASEEVSILAATRDHLSYWVEQFVTNGIIILGLGVNAYAVLLAFLAKGLVNTLNHTNVDFPKLQAGFPWWAYVVSTPNYHAWHHTVTCRKDGNLADVFPLWDIVFGTFERPRGSSANWEFGLDEKERLPDRLVEQLWYPIGQAWKGLRARSVADADRARV